MGNGTENTNVLFISCHQCQEIFIEWVNFCPRQEPWELALLTQTWYTKLANIKLPFLEEIAFGSCVHLKKCKTIKDGLLPSAECKFCRTYFNKLQILCVILIIEPVFESAHSHPGSLLCSSVFLFGIQECGFLILMWEAGKKIYSVSGILKRYLWHRESNT